MVNPDRLSLLHEVADAVAAAFRGVRDFGPSGQRAGQYALDLVADEAALAVLQRAGVGVLSEESGFQPGRQDQQPRRRHASQHEGDHDLMADGIERKEENGGGAPDDPRQADADAIPSRPATRFLGAGSSAVIAVHQNDPARRDHGQAGEPNQQHRDRNVGALDENQDQAVDQGDRIGQGRIAVQQPDLFGVHLSGDIPIRAFSIHRHGNSG